MEVQKQNFAVVLNEGLLISGRLSLGHKEAGLYERSPAVNVDIDTTIEEVKTRSDIFFIPEDNQLLISGNRTLGSEVKSGIYERIG